MDQDIVVEGPFMTTPGSTPGSEIQREEPPTVKKFRVSSSQRSKLDREGRALCRLLYNDGRSLSDIAEIVEVAEVTVTRAVRNGYATRDNVSDDYKFVDDELIDKYNITTPSTAHNTQTVEKREAARNGEETQSPASMKRRGPVPPLPRRPQQTTTDSSKRHLYAQTSTASGHSLANRSRRYTVPARFCPITQERRFSAFSQKDHDSDRASDGLREFLSSLKFDLGKWYPDMTKKGLQTQEDLYAISDWEEERLDKVFKKLLPDMPELHVYALTEGVMDLAKDMRQ